MTNSYKQLIRSVCLAKIFVLWVGALAVDAQQTAPRFRHDYSQTLVMKIMNALVNKDGSCQKVCDFEKTLELIKTIDALTMGVPKIIYLVGWQYNGHDDRYPAFFEVNNSLKRPQDASGLQSLKWLMKEARKYHTTISLHINMTDAYTNSPLWDTYVSKDMISKNKDGSLKVIGSYNGLNAYQINYRNEYENGYAQMRIDKLLALLPELKQSGTIHLDAWFARPSEGHSESNIIEAAYQKKIWQYWNAKGIDVTTEAVLDYMVGMVPFSYHLYPINQDFFLKNPAKVFTGTDFNPDVPSDVDLGFLFGISMNAETIFPSAWSEQIKDSWYLPSDKLLMPQVPWSEMRRTYWTKIFINEFYEHCLQYFFLNRHQRLKVEGTGKNRVAHFSDGVKVSLKDSLITKNGLTLRSKSNLFFPAQWVSPNSYVFYSYCATKVALEVPKEWRNYKMVEVKEVTENGFVKKGNIAIVGAKIQIETLGNSPLLITPK